MSRLFNGSSDYITFTNNVAATVNTTNFSASFWMKSPAISSRMDMAGVWADATNHWTYLFSYITSTVWFYISGNSSDAWGVDSGVNPVAGKWYHFVGTWDGTTQRIYTNGVQTGSALPPITNLDVTSTLGLRLGVGYNGGLNYYYNGELADFAQWRAVLRPSDIANLYNGVRPGSIRPQSLTHWLPLDDQSRGRILDQSSYHNHGTPVGPPLIRSQPVNLQFDYRNVAALNMPKWALTPPAAATGGFFSRYYYDMGQGRINV